MLTLDTVRKARRKVPQVTLLKIVDSAAALRVQHRYPTLSLESETSVYASYLDDVCPLVLIVPMQLAIDTLSQAHVDTRELL